MNMNTKITNESKNLLQEALKELESSKGSVFVAIQKMHRAANLIDDKDIILWCEIQLGNSNYTIPIERYYDALVKWLNNESQENENENEVSRLCKELIKIGLKLDIHFCNKELSVKGNKSGGGFANIGFIEERYADLVRTKRGNDGTYYKINLNEHITYIKQSAHSKAAELYKKLAFADTPQTSLDILKSQIDDKLLDLYPALAENIMIAFESVSVDKPEQWSQALTTCRRFIESLADQLYPPTDDKYNGRLVGQNQYINRLWAFMDKSIESSTNRELAKAHIDFLGNYLQSLYKVTNKGVHSSLTRIEATKAVFHTYLMVADILDYLKRDLDKKDKKRNINDATIDEIEAGLNVSRNIAKEIVKLRVQHGIIDEKILSNIKGIGPKTIEKFKDIFTFDEPA